VFAGAVREAVFSNPDVIRRVNADFVPVALKADLAVLSDAQRKQWREMLGKPLALDD
jgi:hypothetical protein